MTELLTVRTRKDKKLESCSNGFQESQVPEIRAGGLKTRRDERVNRYEDGQ